MSWNTLGNSSHSLGSWKFLEAQSALTFNLPGRYSAVIIVSMDNANSQISLEMVLCTSHFHQARKGTHIVDLEVD